MLPATAAAQRRRRKPAPPPPPAVDTAAEQRGGAERIAAQIKTLTQFLYLLGGVVKSVNEAEQAARGQQATPEMIAQTERSKATVKESIANVQAGLDKLETDFSSKASLRRYYDRLIGISDIAATAERQAEANQFDQAGRSLLTVVSRLTDALLAMSEAGAR